MNLPAKRPGERLSGSIRETAAEWSTGNEAAEVDTRVSTAPGAIKPHSRASLYLPLGLSAVGPGPEEQVDPTHPPPADSPGPKPLSQRAYVALGQASSPVLQYSCSAFVSDLEVLANFKYVVRNDAPQKYWGPQPCGSAVGHAEPTKPPGRASESGRVLSV